MDTNLIYNSSTSQTASADRWGVLYAAGGAIWGTTAGTGQINVMPCAGTLKNFYIDCDAGPGVGLTRTFTIYKNGADTSITITLAGDGTGSGISSGSDTVNTASFSAGDTLSIHMTASGTTTGTGTIRATLAAACAANTSFVVAPGTGNLATGANTFMSLQGRNQDATASNVETVVPTAGTFKNAYGVLSASPGAAKSYTVTLVVNGADSTLTYQISGAVATTGNDTSNSVAVSAGDRVYWKIAPSGTPTARTITVSAEFDPTVNGESIHMYGTNVANTNSANRYNAIVSSAGGSYASGESAKQALTQACEWRKLYIYQQTALASGSYQYQLSKNTTAGNPSVTMTSSSQSGNDTSNTVTSSAADKVSMKISPTSTPTATIAEWGIVSYIAPASGSRKLALLGVG